MQHENSRMTFPERRVADFLKKMNIEWIYEQPVFVWDDNGRPRVWAPDFFLSQFGVYVEVCGSKDFSYDYRKKVFSKNGYCVIFLHVFKQEEKWKYHFKKALHFFLTKRITDFSTNMYGDLEIPG